MTQRSRNHQSGRVFAVFGNWLSLHVLHQNENVVDAHGQHQKRNHLQGLGFSAGIIASDIFTNLDDQQRGGDAGESKYAQRAGDRNQYHQNSTSGQSHFGVDL